MYRSDLWLNSASALTGDYVPKIANRVYSVISDLKKDTYFVIDQIKKINPELYSAINSIKPFETDAATKMNDIGF